jgi:hypothetical protein
MLHAPTALDYLLRFALAAEPCPRHGAARLGAGMLGDASSSALFAIEDALEHVARAAPCRRAVSDDEWLVMTEISLLLPTFEAVYRSGLPPRFLETMQRVPAGWPAWTRVACETADVEDAGAACGGTASGSRRLVAMLGWAAAEDHCELRGRALRCNPRFEQSVALGGADADLLTDTGTLLELKSTSTTRVCSRTDIWQLCGYALADSTDSFGITGVALSALRWRSRIAWPLDSLLARLAGRPVDVGALRHDFATLAQR